MGTFPFYIKTPAFIWRINQKPLYLPMNSKEVNMFNHSFKYSNSKKTNANVDTGPLTRGL